MFDNIDLNDFWDKKDDYYASQQPLSDELIHEIENKLGYKLPESYVRLLRIQNGGIPKNCMFDKHDVIDGIFGIDNETIEQCDFYTKELGFPDIGVPVSTMFEGQVAIFLDYRACGNEGEPKVVQIDLEMDTIYRLTDDFESFIEKLSPYAEYYDDEDNAEADYDENTKPFENVEFYPLTKEQKHQLNSEIWCGVPYLIIFIAIIFFISLVILNLSSEGAVMYKIGKVMLKGITILTLISVPYIISCIIDMNKEYKSYVDTVKDTWEEDEALFKKKIDNDKRKFFYKLTGNPVEAYPNTNNYKVGDRVRVFRSVNDKIIIVKEPDRENGTGCDK